MEFQSLLYQGSTSDICHLFTHGCHSNLRFNPFFIRAVLLTSLLSRDDMTFLQMRSFNPFFIRAVLLTTMVVMGAPARTDGFNPFFIRAVLLTP